MNIVFAHALDWYSWATTYNSIYFSQLLYLCGGNGNKPATMQSTKSTDNISISGMRNIDPFTSIIVKWNRSRLVSQTFFWLWFWFWLVMERIIGFGFVPHMMFILVLVLLMSKSIWISFGFGFGIAHFLNYPEENNNKDKRVWWLMNHKEQMN